MRRRKAGLAAAVCAAALTGCVAPGGAVFGSAPIHTIEITGGYTREEMGYAFGGRDMTVAAKGAALGLDAGAWAGRAAAILAAGPLPVPTRPTAAPGPTARPLYRVVFDMSPGRTQLADQVCAAGPAPDPNPADGIVRVYAALCRGTSALTSGFAEIAVRTADDPALPATLAALARAILPWPRTERTLLGGWRRGG